MKPKRQIGIDQDVYKALKIEAALRDKNPKALVTQWIIENLSPDARKILNSKADSAKIQGARESGTTASNASNKLKLSENAEAISHIKHLWKLTPRLSYTDIADEIGYPKSTVAKNIKRMLERGELEPVE